MDTLKFFTKTLYNLWSILKHPVTNLFIGILIAILILILSQKTKDPVFSSDWSEVIASNYNKPNKLKILWDDTLISNIRTIKIALWNNGNDYIDSKDISLTDPLRIEPVEHIKILSVEQIKTSRTNLNLNIKVVYDSLKKKDVIYLKIKGDEALEGNDGVMLKILFSGDDTRLMVHGRIKGVPSGFREKWVDLSPPRIIKIGLIVLSSLSFFLGLNFFLKGLILKKKGNKVWSWINIIIGFAGFLGFILCIIRTFTYYVTPNWL